MPARTRFARTGHSALFIALLASLTTLACVDGDSLGPPPTGATWVAPALSLAGPDGPSASAGQTDALQAAFERVDRFRLVVRRAADQAVALDTVVTVTPGDDAYDLRVAVRGTPGESFTVEITAYEGTTPLFAADPVQVVATAAADGSAPPPAVQVTLRYAGPGADATEVRLEPATLVLAPGGTGTLAAEVLDGSGRAVAGVPLAWESSAEGTAAVAAGVVTAGGDGIATVAVTTPTGLTAEAPVYVVSGTLAYVTASGLFTRGAAAGDADRRAGPGASAAAWSRDGARLWYASGGMVRQAGDGAGVIAGSWPAESPDGSKLAYASASGVAFANTDGSNATPGPAGDQPVWLDGATLAVGGGAVERVRADGTARSRVGGGSGPAASAGGRIAWVDGGALRVEGRTEPLLVGAAGRPSWSADDRWLAVATARGIELVPADGGSGIPLPGLEGASDPAFRPTGALAQPPEVRVTGLDPDPPVPSREVRILGEGFDWIIPANTRVVWPTRDGSVESEVTAVSPGAVETRTPARVTAGQVRVETRTSLGLLAFAPSAAAVQLSTATPWGRPVAGVVARLLTSDGAEVARGESGADGSLLLTGLAPGGYVLVLEPPAGFTVVGDVRRPLDLEAGTLEVGVEVRPAIQAVHTVPSPLATAVGATSEVRIVALDQRGDTIPVVERAAWGTSGPELSARGDGLRGTIGGVAPGEGTGSSELRVELDGRVFSFPVSVTSFVRGTVTQDTPSGAVEPVQDVTITVFQGERALGSGVSNERGAYEVGGLFRGTYQAVAPVVGERSPVPAVRTVVLDRSQPVGRADFLLARAAVDSIDVAPIDTLAAIDARTTAQVRAFAADGSPLADRSFTFTSSDPSVATVDGSGTVTAVSNGQAWIRAAIGTLLDSARVVVEQRAVSVTILDDDGAAPEADSVPAFQGDTATVLWEARDANGYLVGGRTPVFGSSDASRATVTPAGFVTLVGPGRVELSVALDGAMDVLVVSVLPAAPADVTIQSAADLAAFQAAGWTKVWGSLVIEGTTLVDLSGLESLLEVDGSVLIRTNSALTDLAGLANLRGIGVDLVVEDNAALTSLAQLGALGGIGVDLSVTRNPLLSSKGNLPALAYVSGNVGVKRNGASMGFPLLANVGGALRVGDQLNPGDSSLVTFEAPALTCVNSGAFFEDLTALQTLRIPVLTTAAGPCPVPPSPVTLRMDPPDRWGASSLPPAGSHPAVVAWREVSAAEAEALRRDAVRVRDEHEAEEERMRAARETRVTNMLRELGGPADEGRGRAREANRPDRAAARTVTAGGPVQIIDVPNLTAIDLPELTTMRSWNVFIEDAPLVPELRLPKLTQAGELFVGRTGIRTLSAPVLTRLEFDLDLRTNRVLATIDLPVLAYIGSDLWIYQVDAVPALSLPALDYVEDDFAIWENGALTSIDFPVFRAQEEDSDDIEIYDNPVLRTISMATASALDTGYDLEIYRNPMLETISIPGLRSTYDDFRVWGNPALESVSIATTTTNAVIDGTVFISDNAALRTVDAPEVTRIWGMLVSLNPVLERLSFPKAAESSFTTIETSGRAGVPFTVDLSAVTQVRSMVVRSNPGMTTLSLPALTRVFSGRFEVTGNTELTRIDAPLLDRIDGGLTVSDNPALTDLRFPALSWLQNTLSVVRNDALTSFTFPALTNAQFLVEVSDNAALTSFGFPVLTTQVANPSLPFDISGNPVLTDFDLGQLATVGKLQIQNNAALTRLPAMPSLSPATDLLINANAALADLEGLRGLTALGDLMIWQSPALNDLGGLQDLQTLGSLEMNDVDALGTIALAGLTGIDDRLWLNRNDQLTTVSFPALTRVGAAAGPVAGQGRLRATANGLLTTFDLPLLARIDEELNLDNNAVLANLDGFGALTSAVRSVSITNNVALRDLTGLNNIGDAAPPPGINFLSITNNTGLTDAVANALVAVIESNNPGPNDDVPVVTISGN